MTDVPRRNPWKRWGLIALVLGFIGLALLVGYVVLYTILVTRISYTG